MRKFLSALLCLVMLLSISGIPALANAPIIITVTRWGEVADNDPEKMIIDEFNATNTLNIQVVYDVVPGDGYGDRLTTSFSSGDGYDIFASGEGDFYKWIDKSLARSMDDLIAADTAWVNPMDPAIYAMGNVGGSQYYLVRDYNPIVLWYNKDVFDAAGVAYPAADWSWDDLIAAATALTTKNADGSYATFGFNAQSWGYAVLSYLQSMGLDILSPDGTAVEGYMNDPAVVAALSQYVDFAKGDTRISPNPADLDTFGNSDAMFNTGVLAMTITGGWFKGGLDNAGTNYGTQLLPGNHESYLCASAYAIGTRCKNPEAAWEVIKALTGAEVSQLKAQYSAVLPTITSMLDEMRATYTPAAMALLDTLPYAVQPVGMRSSMGNPAATAFGEAFQRLVYNDGTPESIMNDAVLEVADLMSY